MTIVAPVVVASGGVALLRVAGSRWLRGSLSVATVVIALATGYGWAAWRATQRMDMQLEAEQEGRDLVVVGVIANLPTDSTRGRRFVFAVDDGANVRDGADGCNAGRPGSVAAPGSGDSRDGRERADAQADTGSIEMAEAIATDHPFPNRLLLGWDAPPDDLAPGQRYTFKVRLQRPHGLANPHGFDYEFWLLRAGIGATGYVREACGPAQDAVAERLAWRVARWRAGLRDHIRAALPEDARFAPVLTALVVGDQRGIRSEDWRVFTRSGIGHLISISGLHITMVSGILAGAARWLWRHSFGFGRRLVTPLPLRCPAQRFGLAFAVISGLGYGLIAGMEVPAQRTVAMLMVAAIALWRDRLTPPSLVLAWAAVVAVALDPWAVMSAGFWLSFGAVGVLFLAATAPTASPREASGSDHPPGPLRTAAQRLRASLAQGARAQWVVTIGLVPLTLLLFQQISVVSPIANAVAIPLVSLVVTPLALLGAALPLPIASVPLVTAHALFGCLATMLEILSRPTWAIWQAASPGGIALTLGVLGALLLMSPWAFGLRIRLHGVLLLMPMLAGGRAPVAAGEFRATAFDVGQGSAVLVETHAHVMLFDAGPAYGPAGAQGASAGDRVVVPFLRASGIRQLDMMVITHEDADHAGGARDVMAGLPVAQVVAGVPLRHPLLVPVPGHAAPPRDVCASGMAWNWDGVRFAFLHPLPGDGANAAIPSNARSCVMRVTSATTLAERVSDDAEAAGQGVSLLMTGDIGLANEREIVARSPPENLRADVLVVPHHGSGTSSGEAFLKTVRPDIAIFQLGYRNRYHHPRADVWRRYERLDIERFRTDDTGAVQFTTKAGGLTLTAFRRDAPRYWRVPASAAPGR